MIQRQLARKLLQEAKKYRVITITGPRQSGKTTLVRSTFRKYLYLNLEDPDIRDFAATDPRAFLSRGQQSLILDEIQHVPSLLSYIQTMVDEPAFRGRFILTGSRQFELMRGVNQTLAGRTAVLQLLPLTMEELKQLPASFQLNDYLWRGFYPKIYDKKLDPTSTYKYYFETYIQRDLRQMIAVKDLNAFRKFVKLCAGRIGQIFVASNLANELGLSVPTIQSWLSILEASYIAYLLEPYHVNRGKRLVKSPKLYFYDVGLAAYLLGIENKAQMDRDPLRGAMVENLIISELLKTRYNKGLEHNLFFYRDSNLNEVDVLFKRGNTLIPIEIKSSTTFSSGFLKGLEHISKAFPGNIKGGYLVYGGTTEQNVGGFKVINFRNCASAIK